MYPYNFPALNKVLFKIITSNLVTEKTNWLEEQGLQIAGENNIQFIKKSFSLVSRKIKREPLKIGEGELVEIKRTINDLEIEEWDIQRLSRAWLLLKINPSPKEKYVEIIPNLFNNAEMHELTALYSTLPLLAYPEEWISLCEEGIRSNMGSVLEAIITSNPYPKNHLSVSAWNQLVLKAFFTEQDISKIIGLKERMNEELILALQDYAAERTSANRQVPEKIKELLNYENKE